MPVKAVSCRNEERPPRRAAASRIRLECTRIENSVLLPELER